MICFWLRLKENNPVWKKNEKRIMQGCKLISGKKTKPREDWRLEAHGKHASFIVKIHFKGL